MEQTEQLTDETIQNAIRKVTEKPAPEAIKTDNQAIVFYCKDCKELVSAKKQGKSLTFTCPQCSRNNIAIGTQKSIESYYHLDK